MLREVPFSLDISKVGDQKTVTGIRQGDNDTIRFIITLVNGSSPFNITFSSAITAVIFGLKPDGKLICNFAHLNPNGTVSYTLSSQDTAVAGTVKWQLWLVEKTQSGSRILASPRFSSLVDGEVVNSNDIESNDYILALLNTIADANDHMKSKYSFLYDGQGRIFDITWDRQITSASFGAYNSEKTNSNYYVWLSAAVTSVADNSFPNPENIIRCYWEADPQDVALPDMYSNIEVTYGTNTLKDFYVLASLASLMRDKLETVSMSDLDNELQKVVDSAIYTIGTVSQVSRLNVLRYCKPGYRRVIVFEDDAADFFGVESGDIAKLDVIGTPDNDYADGIYYRTLLFPSTNTKWVQTVTVENSVRTYGDWERKKITYDDLDAELKAFKDYGVTYKYNQLVNSLSALNSPEYCDPKVIYKLHLGGTAYTDLESISNAAKMTVSPRAVYGGYEYIREISFPQFEGFKWVQTVTDRTAENFTVGEWGKIDPSPKITVWDYATSQANDLTVPTSFVGKLGDIVVITTGTGTGGKIFKLIRIVTAAGNSQYFWEEDLTGSNSINKKIDNPSYCFSFDNNKNLLSVIIAGAIGSGAFEGSDVKSIYVGNTVTDISAGIKTTAPNVSVFYIDKNEDDINIDSSLLSDSSIHFYYRGEFNLGNILIQSQKALVDRVATSVDNPAYCISFDYNYNIINKITATVIGLGSFAGPSVERIFISNKVTNIQKEIKTISCPNLSVIYIDNEVENINIASELLNDGNLSILYRGQFNMGNIIINAQKALAERISALETAIENNNS